MMQRLAKRFGRRGLILASVGFVYLIYGYFVAFISRSTQFSGHHGHNPLDWMDAKVWGWLWILCGVISLFVGLQRKLATDQFGFSAAFIAPALWSFFSVYSFTVYLITSGDYGQPNTWAGAAIWLDFVFLVRVCAGWDDPTDPIGPEKAPMKTWRGKENES